MRDALLNFGAIGTIASAIAYSANEVAIRDYNVGTMAAGDRKILELPLTCQRYLRVGAKGTSGAITAHIEMGGKEA